MAIGHQSFYQTQLTSSISDTDLVIPVDNPPIPSEGFLVIEGTVEAKREIIYYTSKDGTSVTCPSGAGNGRGYDGTTAVSHLQGAAVVMAPVGAMFDQLGDITVNSITIGGTPSAEGWSPLGATPDTITANGNRSYDLVFNGTDLTDTITEGMRVRTARTVAAPTYMGGAFNGTTHYFTKTSPTSTLSTVTNNFSLKATIEPTTYAAGYIMARGDAAGNNALGLFMEATGQITVIVRNAAAANFRYISTYQSVPLTKKTKIWVTWASGTVVIMFDGVSVPVTAAGTGGTAPTTAGTGGDFSVGRPGAQNTLYFPGYISDVGVFNAVLTEATMRSYDSQALTGAETNCIGAWSLNNTSVNQQAPGTNDLTATGGVSYSNRSPYGNNGVSTTLDYGIVMKASFSTNTTLTIQVPEGCTIPTSGGIASMDYSIQAVPYGFPKDKGKWRVEANLLVDQSVSTPVSGTKYNISSFQIKVPAGAYWVGGEGVVYGSIGSGSISIEASVSTSSSTFDTSYTHLEAQATAFGGLINTSRFVSPAVSTIYYLIASVSGTSPSAIYYFGGRGGVKLFADNALL